MKRDFFSVQRWWSVVRKEFLQLRRDRITFAMIVGIPIILLSIPCYYGMQVAERLAAREEKARGDA